jgi:hypothetical protein
MFVNRNAWLLGLLLLVYHVSWGQEAEPPSDSLDFAYGMASHTPGYQEVRPASFNRGNLPEVAGLLLGRTPGLLIARQAGDPGQPYALQMRGLSSRIGRNAPLLVIDGLPGASLEMIDPFDLQGVGILKGGAAAAWYGARGAAGVLALRSKGPEVSEGLRLEYKALGAIELDSRRLEVLDASQIPSDNFPFLPDQGASTNWMDEVTRADLSQAHHLALSGGAGTFRYRLSGTLRDQRSALRERGFRRLNGRLSLAWQGLDDRLRVEADAALLSREGSPGFAEAMGYAYRYNPTAPVRFSDPSDPLFDLYGGYYQENRFDYPNPVAIIEQNERRRQAEGQSLGGKLSLEVLPSLTAHLRAGSQWLRREEIELLASNSYWLGSNPRGLARTAEADHFTAAVESWLSYDKTMGDWQLRARAGYAYQRTSFDSLATEALNFQPDFTRDFFDLYLNNPAQAPLPREERLFNLRRSTRMASFFGGAELSWKTYARMGFSLRYDGASVFSPENRWELYPSVFGQLQLGEILGIKTQWQVHGSYAQTGNNLLERFLIFQTGQFNLGADPVAERSRQWEVGSSLGLFSNRLLLQFDYFNRQARDLLAVIGVEVPPNLFPLSLVNEGGRSSRGWELSLLAEVIDKPQHRLQIGLQAFAFRNRIDQFASNEAEAIRFVLIGQAISVLPLPNPQEGDPIGQIYAPQFVRIDADGQWINEDVNGDGFVGDGDYVLQGNAYPTFSSSLSLLWEKGPWQLNALFRSRLGHRKVNGAALYLMSPDNPYNKSVDLLESPFNRLESFASYSSYFVQDASFLQLHNFSLAYLLPTKDTWQLRLYGGAQNLFTLTNYQGIDPEVQLRHSGDPLLAGFEPLETGYLPRTFFLGIDLTL